MYADSRMKTLGERIRELREAQDLSLREFARKLDDKSPAHVSDIENNRRFPSPALLTRMAAILGVGIPDLEKYDIRPPMGDLRRIAQKDPALGVALRKIAEKKIKSSTWRTESLTGTRTSEDPPLSPGPFREGLFLTDGDVDAICVDELQRVGLLPAAPCPTRRLLLTRDAPAISTLNCKCAGSAQAPSQIAVTMGG
jgi:transcriptional regulator with XRE-family HTH domain